MTDDPDPQSPPEETESAKPSADDGQGTDSGHEEGTKSSPFPSPEMESITLSDDPPPKRNAGELDSDD